MYLASVRYYEWFCQLLPFVVMLQGSSLLPRFLHNSSAPEASAPLTSPSTACSWARMWICIVPTALPSPWFKTLLVCHHRLFHSSLWDSAAPQLVPDFTNSYLCFLHTAGTCANITFASQVAFFLQRPSRPLVLVNSPPNVLSYLYICGFPRIWLAPLTAT